LRGERSQIIKAVSLDNRREQKKEESKKNGVVMRFFVFCLYHYSGASVPL
jgi:hypothetical protein